MIYYFISAYIFDFSLKKKVETKNIKTERVKLRYGKQHIIPIYRSRRYYSLEVFL